MANKPGVANFFPDAPVYPEMGAFQPVYGKFDLTTYIQGASDYEIMAFLVGKYNACLEAYGTVTKLSTDTVTACKQLQVWVNSWFDNLDVQEELNKKIDSMVADGSFETLLHKTFDEQINQQAANTTTAWLVANVTPTGSAVVVDKSLSIEGAAADAKITGDSISANKNLIFYLESGAIVPNMTDFIENGHQLFNYKRATLHLYYSASGIVSTNNALSGYYIKVKPSSTIYVRGGNVYGASFTLEMKWIESYINQKDGTSFILPDNAEWLYISIATSEIQNIVISYTTDEFWLREYSAIGKYLEGATPYKIYEYTYIKKQRACCNQGTSSVCAYYASVDCKTKVNIITCSWIWEKGTNSGTLALIINPNGIKKISDIVNLSLHLQIRNNYIALDVLGKRFNKYYYQSIIHKDIDPMNLDNKTEHTVSLIANTENNACSVIIDGAIYSGNFIPDSNLSSINDVLGNYATFEHYSSFDRASAAMPQVTSFTVRKDDDYIVYDNFKRQDGQLQNTPQGHPYYLLSTLHNHG